MLRDEHGAVWKKRETPGIFESPGESDDPNPLSFPRIELQGLIGQPMTGEAPRRHWNVVLERDLLLGPCGRRTDGGCEYQGEDDAKHMLTYYAPKLMRLKF